MLTTTITKIEQLGAGDFSAPDRRNKFSQKAWERLSQLATQDPELGKNLPVKRIYEEVGITDAIWALETIETTQGHDRELALFGLGLCRHYVEPLITCPTNVEAIAAAESYARGTGSRDAVAKALNAAEQATKKHKQLLESIKDRQHHDQLVDQISCQESAQVICWIVERANFETPNLADPTKTGRTIAGYATGVLRKYALTPEDQAPKLLLQALCQSA